MADFNPSYATVKSAIITSHDGTGEVDLKGVFFGLSLTQTINSSAWFGKLSILDSTGMLENEGFKIRGEETLVLTVESYDLKLAEPLELHCQVISVDNVVPTENLSGVSFDLNFVSAFSYKVGKRRVRQSFKDLRGDEIAERIFKKFYGKVREKNQAGEVLPFEAKKYITTEQPVSERRNFTIQPTEGSMRAVIPNLMPADAMNFLAARSFSSNSPSCTFRFFETFKGFYFVTDEFLIRYGIDNQGTIEEFAYNAQNSQDSQQRELQTNTFRSFKNPTRVNTAADIASGAYRNTVIEVDLGRRRARNINYNYVEDANYLDMTGRRTTLINNPHTEPFIEETFTEENAKRFIVFKDYYDESGETLRANQHFPEIVQNRNVYAHHLGQTVVEATLVGRLDLEPGKIIKVKVPAFTIVQNPDNPYNKQLSGNYMIVSISHQIKDDVLNTNMTLAKYSWSGDYQE